MKSSFCLLALATVLLSACGKSDSTSADSKAQDSSADYAGALGRSRNRAITTVDLESIKKAIQLFNVQEGRNPKDLNELVAGKYIGKIPETPPGMKLVYDSASGNISMAPQ